MADVSKRARDAAGAAADRLRRAVEASPLGGLLEDQQHNLNDLLAQVQNTELRAKLTALYDQQQHAFVELAHTVQTNVTAQQHHLADVLNAVEDTLKARRAKVEDADPADDLSDDDSDTDEAPREAPFADVPAAKDVPADIPPPAGFAPPTDLRPAPGDLSAPGNQPAPEDLAAPGPPADPPQADFAPPVPPVTPITPVSPKLAKKAAPPRAAKKAPSAGKKAAVATGHEAPTPLEMEKAAKKAAKKPPQP